VMAIMSLLAAVLFTVGPTISKKKTLSRAQTELAQIVSAINDYKRVLGTYPPSNPTNTMLNGLYYELRGTTMTSAGAFSCKDGTSLTPQEVASDFGVGGFLNVSKSSGEDSVVSHNFLPSLPSSQVAALSDGKNLLVCSVKWPQKLAYQPVSGYSEMNPWRYNSVNPTNNPGAIDLWVDVVIGDKTNRVCNWTDQILTVSTP